MRSRNVAHPLLKCAGCLYRVGLGYDRIGRRLGLRKKKVSTYLQLRIRNRVLSRQLLITKPAKVKPIPLSPEQRAELCLSRLPAKKLKVYLRKIVWCWFKHGLYPRRAVQLVGCSRPDFIAHISSQFRGQMSLSNYGSKWELDHIVACARFNLFDAVQRQRCFHYTNLRPAFIRENRVKAASLVPCQPELAIALAQ